MKSRNGGEDLSATEGEAADGKHAGMHQAPGAEHAGMHQAPGAEHACMEGMGRAVSRTDLLGSALPVARAQHALVLHLDFLAHHHERALLGPRAQLELHLQPAELALHILDARVVVRDAPARARGGALIRATAASPSQGKPS